MSPRCCRRCRTHRRRTSSARTPISEPVEIKVRANGPYKVTGPVRIVDADGVEFEIPEPDRPIVLCRCGQSKTKPFCDSTHKEVGFDAPSCARV